MGEPETNTPQPLGGSELDPPLAEAVEKYRQLIRQNHAFTAALGAAIRSGSETAAGVTATVRTRSSTFREKVGR